MAYDPMAYLGQNRLLHIDMIEALRLGHGTVVAAGPQGVLMDVERQYLMSAQSAGVAAAMCDGVQMEDVLAHQDSYLPMLREKYGMRQYMACHQVVWNGPAPEMPADGIKMRTLDAGWLPVVEQTYGVPVGSDYLRQQLERGVVSGAFIDGALAGFAGEHSEGAMGMLEVLPPYRRRGVGRALVVHSLRRYIGLGRVPFAQVDIHNEASLKMQRGLGFEVSAEVVYFYGTHGGEDAQEGDGG